MGLGCHPKREQSQPAIRIEITGEGLAALAGIVGGGNASDNYSYTKQGGGDGQGEVLAGEWREAEAEE